MSEWIKIKLMDEEGDESETNHACIVYDKEIYENVAMFMGKLK